MGTLVTRTVGSTLETAGSGVFPTFPDGFQQDAACVADGGQIGRVVPLGPHLVERVGRRQAHGSC